MEINWQRKADVVCLGDENIKKRMERGRNIVKKKKKKEAITKNLDKKKYIEWKIKTKNGNKNRKRTTYI